MDPSCSDFSHASYPSINSYRGTWAAHFSQNCPCSRCGYHRTPAHPQTLADPGSHLFDSPIRNSPYINQNILSTLYSCHSLQPFTRNSWTEYPAESPVDLRWTCVWQGVPAYSSHLGVGVNGNHRNSDALLQFRLPLEFWASVRVTKKSCAVTAGPIRQGSPKPPPEAISVVFPQRFKPVSYHHGKQRHESVSSRSRRPVPPVPQLAGTLPRNRFNAWQGSSHPNRGARAQHLTPPTRAKRN